jgi:hypothetical protein
MLIEKYFCTSHLYNLRHALQSKSCALQSKKISGVCRQLSYAHLNYFNANVLLSAINVIVARPAVLVPHPGPLKTFFARKKKTVFMRSFLSYVCIKDPKNDSMRRLLPRGGLQENRFSCGVFLRFNKTGFMFSTALTPPVWICLVESTL